MTFRQLIFEEAKKLALDAGKIKECMRYSETLCMPRAGDREKHLDRELSAEEEELARGYWRLAYRRKGVGGALEAAMMGRN